MKKGKSDSDILCDICHETINIAAGGKTDIEKHSLTTKHTKALNARSNSRTVNNYYASAKDFSVAACEGVWAYHVVRSNHSFRSSDCASKIFRTCFEMRMFHCARTKCESIVTNVLAPYAADEIKKELASVNYVTISTDASNRGNVKMFPVLARYFIPEIGVRVKLLEYSSEKGESSIIISNLLKKTADEFQIKDKLVGFCGDNCPTNFGSSQRGGQNNVYYHMKQWIPLLIGVGCAAHIVHSTLKSTCDAMPIDIECVVVKIYSYFYIYTVRVEALKSICDDLDGVDYSQLLGYAKTRFLALGQAIGKILNIYEALKAYFLGLRKGEVMLKSFFNNPLSKLWLLYVKEQVSSFIKQWLCFF